MQCINALVGSPKRDVTCQLAGGGRCATRATKKRRIIVNNYD